MADTLSFINAGAEYNTVEISLSEAVEKTVTRYLDEVNGFTPMNLHNLVMEEVESSLLALVMQRFRYNQTKAARVLNISRGTLRTKLRKYHGDTYIGFREDSFNKNNSEAKSDSSLDSYAK